jgi:hypothetical protein
MSIKRLVLTLDRAGLSDTGLRRWLNEYDGPGEHRLLASNWQAAALKKAHREPCSVHAEVHDGSIGNAD